MNKKLYSIIIISSMLIACNSSLEHKIMAFELENNACQIKGNIQVSSAPFYASDSILILNNLFEQTRIDHIASLKSDIDTLQKEITRKEKEATTISNEVLLKHFTFRVEQMKYRSNQIKANLKIYQNHPELTQLKVFQDKILTYAADSNLLIGYKIDASFIGKQGLLKPIEYQKVYFSPPDKQDITAEFTEKY